MRSIYSPLFIALLTTACTDAKPARCVPGQQSACPCGGREGVQICAASGEAYGACRCGGGTATATEDTEDTGTTTTPDTGPASTIRNPSFEIGGAPAMGWVKISRPADPADCIGALGGTSFMPTDGVQFLSLKGVADARTVPSCGRLQSVYQDAVNLTGYTTLIFDWEIPPSSRGTASIYFTASGTTTLWQVSVLGTDPGRTKKDEEVPLTATGSGRLTIEWSAGIAPLAGAPGYFKIDNLRLR